MSHHGGMSEFARTPGVIPYVLVHDGPRRLLTIDAVASGMLQPAAACPVIGIDGQQYQTLWGRATFEIPADRNVHVSAHVTADDPFGFASVLLPPAPTPVLLNYERDGLVRWGLFLQ